MQKSSADVWARPLGTPRTVNGTNFLELRTSEVRRDNVAGRSWESTGREVKCLDGRKRRGHGLDRQMAEPQLSELQNARVLLEGARGPSRNLAYHRRARPSTRWTAR